MWRWIIANRNEIGLTLYLLTLVADIITDYRRWLREKRVNHTMSNWVAAAPVAVSLWLMGWYSLGLLFTYWMLKDAILGTLMARTPLYAGTTAKFDRLQRKYPWLMVAKFVLGTAGIVLFVLKNG